MNEKHVFGATFRDHLAALNLRAARTGYVLATVLIPTGVLLEIVVYPDYIDDFFGIRVVASGISFALLASTFYPLSRGGFLTSCRRSSPRQASKRWSFGWET